MPTSEYIEDKHIDKSTKYKPFEIDVNQSDEEIYAQIESYIIFAVESGISQETIIKDLERNGITKKDSKIITESVITNIKKKFNDNAAIEIAIGIVIIVFGAILTGISYSAASNGGTFRIASGAFVFGSLSVLHGIYKLITGKSIKTTSK